MTSCNGLSGLPFRDYSARIHGLNSSHIIISQIFKLMIGGVAGCLVRKGLDNLKTTCKEGSVVGSREQRQGKGIRFMGRHVCGMWTWHCEGHNAQRVNYGMS